MDIDMSKKFLIGTCLEMCSKDEIDMYILDFNLLFKNSYSEFT